MPTEKLIFEYEVDPIYVIGGGEIDTPLLHYSLRPFGIETLSRDEYEAR